MILVAAVALLLAILCGVVGWLAFGQGMTVNVLSGLIELLLGIAVAVFVIDQVTKRQRKREWAAAYSAINGLLAASFVDVMRLLHIRVCEYYADDEDSYGDFVQIAVFHAAALRSTIEGFATMLEPKTHQLFRASELRLAWLIQKLADQDAFCPGEEYAQRAYTVAEDISELLERQGDPRYISARRASVRIVRKFLARDGGEHGLAEALAKRYPAQTQLLHDLGRVHGSGRYIFDDVDNDLAIAYYALDRELLSAAQSSLRAN